MKEQTIYVIAGPTASGKSGLALALAEKIKGQIVNADASQVYQGLRVLSARPDEKEEAQCPHYLYGYADNQTQVNMADWLRRAKEIIPSLSCPIVVGGTGLYLNALIKGISQIPEIPEEIRSFVRQMPDEERKQRLKEVGCPVDPQRQKRVLEVLLTTGKTMEYFQKLGNKKVIQGDFKTILLQPPREEVYQNCAKRLEIMLAQGAIQEVESLLKSGASGGVLKAIGVPELTRYLKNEISLLQAKELILLATRHYAKRQRTWFRHQFPALAVLDRPELEKVITL